MCLTIITKYDSIQISYLIKSLNSRRFYSVRLSGRTMGNLLQKIKKNILIILVIIGEVLLLGHSYLPVCGTELNFAATPDSTEEAPATSTKQLPSPRTNPAVRPSTSSTGTFDEGMATLTFDDGWLSQYSTALPIIDAANFKGSFYIITHDSMSAHAINSIANPGLETRDPKDSKLPAYWFVQSEGNNRAGSQYPVAGINGTCAARVSMYGYKNGEVEWLFDETSIVGGHEYEYSSYYKSSATTTLVARFTKRDGTRVTRDLETVPPAKSWTPIKKMILMPKDATMVTVYQRLASNGTLTIDTASLEHLQRYMDMTEVKEIWNEGHEVGPHTLTHPDLTSLPIAEATEEIVESRNDLAALGITPLDLFIYPYGYYNDNVINILKQNGFRAARGGDIGYNYPDTPKYRLRTQQIDRNTTFDEFKYEVDTAIREKSWVIFMFHQIDTTGEYYAIPPAEFQKMIDYLKERSIRVVTLEEGVDLMNP